MRITCSANVPCLLSRRARAAVCRRSRSWAVMFSARRTKTLPRGVSPGWSWPDELARTSVSREFCRSWAYETAFSFRITRSTASCFMRQYSWARSSWRTIS